MGTASDVFLKFGWVHTARGSAAEGECYLIGTHVNTNAEVHTRREQSLSAVQEVGLIKSEKIQLTFKINYFRNKTVNFKSKTQSIVCICR